MDFNNLVEASGGKTRFHLESSGSSSNMEFPLPNTFSYSSSTTFCPNMMNLNLFPCTSRESMEAMRETIFRMAVMQPIHGLHAEEGDDNSEAPKRRNVKISKDPQSVAARHRRERISQRIRTLQRMVPGGSKLDTASMLDEAVHYLKFLKKQLQILQQHRN